MLKKSSKRVARIALSALLSLSMVLPGDVSVKAFENKDYYLDTLFECSSEGKDFCKINITYGEGMPKGGGAHLYYYDDGVKYENEEGKPLSAYEGGFVYIETNPVAGYTTSIEFSDDPEMGNYGNEQYSLKDFEDEFYNGSGVFQVPKAENITVKVKYETANPVKLYYTKYNTYHELLFQEQEIKAGADIELPNPPEIASETNAPAFCGWFYNNQLYQPGDHIQAVVIDEGYYDGYNYTKESNIAIQGTFLPPISYSDGLKGRVSCSNESPVLLINADQTTKKILSLTAKGYKNETESNIDIYNADTMPFIYLRYLTGYDRVAIEAQFSEEDTDDLVLDLTNGESDDLSEDTADVITHLENFNPKELRIDRAGYSTPASYTALDLNNDGHLDVKYGSAMYDYHFDEVNDISYLHYYYPSKKLYRMAGAELCEEDSYLVETNLPSVHSVRFNLFKSYPVKFLDGDTVYSEIKVRKGKKAEKPKDPVKDGYTLKGWKIAAGSVSGNSIGDLYDFEKPVTSEFSLSAVWEKKEDQSTGKDPQPTVDPNPTTDPGKDSGKKVIGEPVGTSLTTSSAKIQYKVTKQGDAQNPPEVSYKVVKKKQGKKKTVKVPDTVTIKGVTYKVTSVTAKSLAYEKKAKTIILGENIEKLAANALKGCRNLKTLKLLNKEKVVTLSKKSFNGIKGKITLYVPENLYSKYKALIKKLKLTKKIKLKSL